MGLFGDHLNIKRALIGRIVPQLQLYWDMNFLSTKGVYTWILKYNVGSL